MGLGHSPSLVYLVNDETLSHVYNENEINLAAGMSGL